ncbi:MAG: hypothetical protein ACRDMV_02320 [Streptosporangiales bacterium]
MTRPYGVEPAHPNADLLEKLMVERYGPVRDLEAERFTTVPRRRRQPLGEATLANRRFHRLAVVLARIDDGRPDPRETA